MWVLVALLIYSAGTHHAFAGPVEFAVVGEASSFVQVLKELPQVLVVGSLEEVEPPDVAKVSGHFFGVAVAEDFYGSRSFGISYFLIPLLQGVGFQSLPGQTSSQEVHEHVTQGLQVVSSTLFWNIPIQFF